MRTIGTESPVFDSEIDDTVPYSMAEVQSNIHSKGYEDLIDTNTDKTSDTAADKSGTEYDEAANTPLSSLEIQSPAFLQKAMNGGRNNETRMGKGITALINPESNFGFQAKLEDWKVMLSDVEKMYVVEYGEARDARHWLIRRKTANDKRTAMNLVLRSIFFKDPPLYERICLMRWPANLDQRTIKQRGGLFNAYSRLNLPFFLHYKRVCGFMGLGIRPFLNVDRLVMRLNNIQSSAAFWLDQFKNAPAFKYERMDNDAGRDWRSKK